MVDSEHRGQQAHQAGTSDHAMAPGDPVAQCLHWWPFFDVLPQLNANSGVGV
jgi:hypothetical protein